MSLQLHYSKFRENRSIGIKVVPHGRTDRRADITKLIAYFRSSAIATNM